MNILIVDDEYYIVQGIVNGIDWESLGIQKIFTAFSIAQAKEVFSKETIHILLTDIEMPRGTGFDLIRWANENQYNPVPIILTGHQQFDYAMEAINQRCISYVLKPFTPDSLCLEISKAVDAARQIFSDEQRALKDSSFLSSVMRCVSQNIDSPDLSRNMIADVIHMNPDYISYLFHKEAGIPLSTYILNQRLELAKKLLLTTNLSLSDISLQCGFTSSSYFHQRFKKYCGMTPQQFRSSNSH